MALVQEQPEVSRSTLRPRVSGVYPVNQVSSRHFDSWQDQKQVPCRVRWRVQPHLAAVWVRFPPGEDAEPMFQQVVEQRRSCLRQLPLPRLLANLAAVQGEGLARLELRWRQRAVLAYAGPIAAKCAQAVESG